MGSGLFRRGDVGFVEELGEPGQGGQCLDDGVTVWAGELSGHDRIMADPRDANNSNIRSALVSRAPVDAASPQTLDFGIPKSRGRTATQRRPWVAYAAPPRGSVLTAGRRVVVKAVRRLLDLPHPVPELIGYGSTGLLG